MPLGLLLILGVGVYLYVQQQKTALGPGLTDPNAIYKGWVLLTAWSQSQSGQAPAVEPASITDPTFVSLTQEFQIWANGKGYVYQPAGGQAAPLRTDGVLDAPTLAVLDAHVQMTAPTGGPQSFTTGGYYYLSFVRGTSSDLTPPAGQWTLSSEVDSPPAPAGLTGPAAWLAELGAGRSIAIGLWQGPQYGTDDKVMDFGVVRNPVTTSAAWNWNEITSSVVAPTSAPMTASTGSASPAGPGLAQPGCYRVSYDTLGTARDSAAAAAAKATADGSFELQGFPPAPSSGGPWPIDDVGTAMPSGTSGAGMPAASPLPRVRLQWCITSAQPWPLPAGATGVRVWEQAEASDVVTYGGIAITLRDGGASAPQASTRWSAMFALPTVARGAAPAPGSQPIAMQSGPTRQAALSKAEAAIDVLPPAYNGSSSRPPQP